MHAGTHTQVCIITHTKINKDKLLCSRHPAPKHRTLIHFCAPYRSTCTVGLNKQTHSFFAKKPLPFPTEPWMIAGAWKHLSQSICPEALNVLSDAHRLPGSRNGVGGRRKPLKGAVGCSRMQQAVEGRYKMKVTTHRWGRKKHERMAGK